jgi:hypothetical protein
MSGLAEFILFSDRAMRMRRKDGDNSHLWLEALKRGFPLFINETRFRE